MNPKKIWPKEVWVVRTDRLGDVLMSLGSLISVKRSLPGCHVSFVCRGSVIDAIDPLLAAEGIDAIDVATLAVRKAPDAALILFDEPKVTWWLFRQRTRLRVGNYSKPLSFLTLSHGHRQKRSLAEKTEAQYNEELTRKFLALCGSPAEVAVGLISIPIDTVGEAEAKVALGKLGVSGPFSVLHPGMGGSALNLSEEKYLTVYDTLVSAQRGDVLVSVGPSATDESMALAFQKARPTARFLSGLSLSGLRETFRRASVVVAPSTGTIHLAHYVGTPTLGIYPPVRSQHPRRWGPTGGTGKTRVLVPTVDCPATTQCLGERCAHHPCLEAMDWRGLILSGVNDLTGG